MISAARSQPLSSVNVRAVPTWLVRLDLAILAVAAPFLLFPRTLTFVVAPLLLLPWLLRKRVTGSFSARTPLDWPIVGLALMLAVSLAVSTDLDLSLPKFWGLVLGGVVYYSLVNNLNEQRALWWTALGLVVLGVLIALVALVGTEWNSGKVPLLGAVYARLPLLIGGLTRLARGGFGPNEVGGTLATLLPLVVGVFVGAPRRARLPIAVAGLVMLGVLALTLSRSALIGLLVGGLYLLAWRSGRVTLALTLVVALAIAVFVGVGPERILGEPGPLEPGSADPLDTFAARVELWDRAWLMIQDFPFTGIGLNTFPVLLDRFYPLVRIGEVFAPHAHNVILQTAVDFGLPGLLAFVAILTGFYRAAWLTMHRRGHAFGDRETERFRWLAAGLLGGMTAYLVFGLTDAITLGAKPGVILWVYFALAVRLAALSAPPARSTDPAVAPAEPDRPVD